MFREPVRQRLAEQLAPIEVFESHIGDQDRPAKPFVLIHEATSTEDTPWTGYTTMIQVAPFVDRLTLQALDPIVDKIISTLDGVLLADKLGNGFVCEFTDKLPETVDSKWDALTRIIRFGVRAWRPEVIKPDFPVDPAIEALVNWAPNVIIGLVSYALIWPQGYVWPSVMWRIVDMDTRILNAKWNWVIATIRGHVLATTHAERVQISQLLAARASLDYDIPTLTGKLINLIEPRADLEADPFKLGQIQLKARYIITLAEDLVPKIEHLILRSHSETIYAS